MVAPIRQTSAWDNGFDAIIDVRTPHEYDDDHIPGAINLPVLSNDERAEVGKIYKQVSPFKARQLGAQYAARNIADNLDTLMQHDAAWRPLVYCWRGGQRSGSLARILAEIGWVTTVLDGGYKTYRDDVMSQLDELAAAINPVLVQGPTGSAKTHIINTAKTAGVQVIDLEDMAAHRGSLLGAEPDRVQPSQRLFETLLCDYLKRLDPSKPVLIEAESSKIGNCYLPQGLWKQMSEAPQILIQASVESRVDFLMRDYPHLIADPSHLNALIDGMVNRHGHDITQNWRQLAEDQDWPQFVRQLITEHYDPAYAKSSSRKDGHILGTICPKSLDAEGITAAAQEIPGLLTNLH